MREGFETRLLRYVRGHVLETLTLLYLIPLLWGGLVPFDFGGLDTSGPAPATILGLPAAKAHLPDVLSNVALYLPLGLLLRAMLLSRGWSKLTSLVASCTLGFALSYGTEFSQLFSPSRVSSFADLAANMGGMFVGVLLGSWAVLIGVLGRELGEWCAVRLRENLRARPCALGAQACALVLLLASVAPFDVTFSPNRILQSAQDARWVPFSRAARISSAMLPAAESPMAPRQDVRHRESWQLIFDYVWTVAGFALLAILLYRYLSVHCHVTGLRPGLTTVFIGGMVGAVGTVARLFVISRTVDVTEVLLAILGSAVGVLLAERVFRAWAADRAESSDAGRAQRYRFAVMILGGWCLLLAARELAPFTPHFSPSSIRAQLGSIEWLPMRAYQGARLPVALDDLLTKLSRYMGLGILLCLVRRLDPRAPRRVNVLAASFYVALAVATLEAMQLFLPSRVPSVTDVLLAAVGAGVGVVAYRVVRAILEEAIMPAVTARPVLFNVEFDPDSPAPLECVPQPPPPAPKPTPPTTPPTAPRTTPRT